MSALIDGGAELRILVLFALRKLTFGVTAETAYELVTAAPGTGSLTYFETLSALNSLVETEHLTLDGSLYAITKKGITNGEVAQTDIPYSVRNHTEAAALELLAAHKRAELIRTSKTITRRGSYSVELSLSDGREEVLFLRMAAATRDQAEQLESALRDRAEVVFNAIMRELQG